MNHRLRRGIVAIGLLILIANVPCVSFAQNQPSGSLLRQLDFSPYRDDLDALPAEEISRFDSLLLERSVSGIAELMDEGDVSAYDVTLYFLYRIENYDVGKTNAVVDLDPRALDIARELDQERENGTVRGPLHGIPVLLKDSISTEDSLYTTAGAAALSTHMAGRDAFAVEQLRNAGAIILGKTNMTEWANWMHYAISNGYSAVGGQTYSPYGDWLDPSGSSTGSAVAVSMNFAPLAIGVETIGSIISPSARSSVVGMKPSLGLISRDYVIPISDEFDTAGPIGRNVTDVALALNALASEQDVDDPLSENATPLFGSDFTAGLSPEALQGVRVGLVAMLPAESEADNLTAYSLWDDVEAFERAGAEVIMLYLPGAPDTSWPLLLNCDMHEDVDAYLQESGAEFSSLQEITEFNELHPEYMPYGQGLLYESTACTMTHEETSALGEDIRQSMNAYMEDVFTEHDIDLLVSIDAVSALEYALAGWRGITVPRLSPGSEAPTGLTLIGPYLSDVDLLGYAYAYERESHARTLPILVIIDPNEDD